jgi:hypothetical protein
MNRNLFECTVTDTEAIRGPLRAARSSPQNVDRTAASGERRPRFGPLTGAVFAAAAFDAFAGMREHLRATARLLRFDRVVCTLEDEDCVADAIPDVGKRPRLLARFVIDTSREIPRDGASSCILRESSPLLLRYSRGAMAVCARAG